MKLKKIKNSRMQPEYFTTELQGYTVSENLYVIQQTLRENLIILVNTIQSDNVSWAARDLADKKVIEIIKNLRSK